MPVSIITIDIYNIKAVSILLTTSSPALAEPASYSALSAACEPGVKPRVVGGGGSSRVDQYLGSGWAPYQYYPWPLPNGRHHHTRKTGEGWLYNASSARYCPS